MSMTLQPDAPPHPQPRSLAEQPHAQERQKPIEKGEITTVLLNPHLFLPPPAVNLFRPIRPLLKKLQTLIFPSGDQYILGNRLGEGRYGTVYRATLLAQKKLPPHSIAIKISHPQSGCYRAQSREENIVRKLNEYSQTSVVNFLEGFSYYNKQRYTAYELLSSSLSTKIASNPNGLSLEETKMVAKKLFKSLVYLLLMKVVHSDIKPSNIVFTDANEKDIRLIDFGKARMGIDPLVRKIQAMAYRAPEVAMGLAHNEAADMWSVGCVLAKLYTGSRLFPSAKNQDRDANNRNLLLNICKKIGPIPQHMLQQSPLCRNAASRNAAFLEQLNAPHENRLRHFLTKTKDPSPKEETPEEAIEHVEEEAFIDLIQQILTINPEERITAVRALQHPFILGFSKPLNPDNTPLEEADPENKE